MTDLIARLRAWQPPHLSKAARDLAPQVSAHGVTRGIDLAHHLRLHRQDVLTLLAELQRAGVIVHLRRDLYQRVLHPQAHVGAAQFTPQGAWLLHEVVGERRTLCQADLITPDLTLGTPLDAFSAALNSLELPAVARPTPGGLPRLHLLGGYAELLPRQVTQMSPAAPAAPPPSPPVIGVWKTPPPTSARC